MDEAEVLQMQIFGNTLKDYMIAGIVSIVFFITIFLIERIAIKRFRQMSEVKDWGIGKTICDLCDKMVLPLFYLGAFYFAVKQLTLEPAIEKFINGACLVLLTLQLARLLSSVLVLIVEYTWFNRDIRSLGSAASKGLITIIRIVVWGLGGVFVLDNLGFNISAIVAGLGIGGIAVAFAAQAILGDLFNYFVIFFDKPFEEGDFIILGDYLGTIERIGLKTTRIRSLSGEQIIIGNSDLTSNRIRNYKRMERRRVLFKLGVTYQTPKEKMEKIPGMIRNIVKGMEDTAFDRAHFQAIGDFGFNLEVVYFVLSPDYNKFMDIQQKINFAIMEAFEKEGLVFAYPTQTLFLNAVKEEPAGNNA